MAAQCRHTVERMRINSPLEHYSLCRSLLTESDPPNELIEYAIRHPYARTYQLSIAASALLLGALKRNVEPLIPRVLKSGAPCPFVDDLHTNPSHLSFPLAIELASLWKRLGCHEAALQVERWVSQFTGAARNLFLSEIEFLQLKQERVSSPHLAFDATLGLMSVASDDLDLGLSLTGCNSALGSLRRKTVSIPAFGPQFATLSDSNMFGLSHLYAHGAWLFSSKGAAELEGWTRCHGSKESWLYVKAHQSSSGCDLTVKLVSNSAQPHYFTFFVQAMSCSLQDEALFLPNSLKRYQGLSRPLCFDETLCLSCNQSAIELQIIPLAGSGCYWNANFLIAYTLPSYAEVSFRISF